MTDLAENAGWKWLTAVEVSELTGIPRPTLYAWVHRGGKGPPFYKLGESVRYRSDEVDAWLLRSRRDGDGSIPADRIRGVNGRYIRVPT